MCVRADAQGRFFGFLIYYEVIISTFPRAYARIMGYKESCNAVTGL